MIGMYPHMYIQIVRCLEATYYLGLSVCTDKAAISAAGTLLLTRPAPPKAILAATAPFLGSVESHIYSASKYMISALFQESKVFSLTQPFRNAGFNFWLILENLWRV